MVLGTKEADSFVSNVGNNKIESSTEVTSLGVKIDKQLNLKVSLKNCAEKQPINYILYVGLESI